MFEPAGPSEPYTTYEGRRYVAEMRQDCTHLWTQVEFIHWWIRRVSTPTLASTGILGQPATAPLIGDDTIGPREFSGIRATVGWWRDPERLQSLELTGFW